MTAIKRTNFLTKGYNLATTFLDWAKAGYPGRHPDDVKSLFDEHCKPCEAYDPNARSLPFLPVNSTGICVACGCHVSDDANEWVNALTIPVKACPLGKFSAPVLPKKPDEPRFPNLKIKKPD